MLLSPITICTISSHIRSFLRHTPISRSASTLSLRPELSISDALPKSTDVLVIGGGIVGLCIARELRKRKNVTITVLDKESSLGYHSSGRNSGVMHAGFYYTVDSLKAKFCRDGRQAWSEYCSERNLPANRCGKLVVARNEKELPTLDVLYERGKKNGVNVSLIDAKEALELEPLVHTMEGGKVLWSPDTFSIDPQSILSSILSELRSSNVSIVTNTSYLHRLPSSSNSQNVIQTSQGPIESKLVINCAGMYADKIAHDFNIAHELCMLPFKGLYLYLKEELNHTFPMKRQVYPVPNIEQPFLGTHYTVTSSGRIKIGPSAIPALWRENYSGISENFSFNEMMETLSLETQLLFSSKQKLGFSFAKLAAEELPKNFKSVLLEQASKLTRQGALPMETSSWEWGNSGIRAQLMDKQNGKLLMDFMVERGHNNDVHVLNAVSPAFTCAIPFSKHVVDITEQIESKM